MKQILFQSNSNDLAPRITEDSIYPNIDSSYTEFTYTGQRLAIVTTQKFGIKTWTGSRPAYQQGIGIYGNLLASFSNGSTHYLYTIGTNGTLTQVKSFTLSTGHSNALQFAPTIESGQVYPYLYVSGTSGKCYVVSIAADYTPTIVQTITYSAGQMLIGDDGYMWGSNREGETCPRIFTKYRKVAVSEGDVTLTSNDVVDSFATDKIYSTTDVTAQGWSVKYGKIWFCYGMNGNGQKRGVDVYDTATHRRLAELDITNFTNLELEDVDFYNNALLIATYDTNIYEVRF